jgi:hypothetical protein
MPTIRGAAGASHSLLLSDAEVKELELAKEFLWEHGRVCNRCGVAYLI